MKILTTFLLSFSITYFSFAQKANADSLKHELIRSKEDTNKVKTYYLLATLFKWTFPDTAIRYSLDGLELAEKLNFKQKQIELLHALGEALAGKGNFTQALETQLRSLELSEKIKDRRLITLSYCNIGLVYYYAKDFKTALNYFLQAKTYPEIYSRYKKIISAFIGETYFHLDKIDSAFSYIKTTYVLEIADKGHWSVPHFYMGKIAARSGKRAEALRYYRAGIHGEVPTLDTINGYIGIAGIYKDMNLFDSAVFYAKQALNLGERSLLLYTVIDATAILKDVYKRQNRADSAFKYMEIMLAALDSLFSREKVQQLQNLSYNEQMRQRDIQAATIEYKNRLKILVLVAALLIALIAGALLWRNNHHKQQSYILLQKQKEETEHQKTKVEQAYAELKNTQAQLIQKEKMASLGELTAGIAHEIQNPLNFINNFSVLNRELLLEMEQELAKGNFAEAKAIAENISVNEEKITFHGNRADSIVKGMLQHSRGGSGKKQLTNLNALANEYLKLTFHGLRAKDKNFNAEIQTFFDDSLLPVNVVPQDIGRVFLNLFSNAFHSVSEKSKKAANGYLPVVTVSTKDVDGKVEIKVKDNGIGMPEGITEKIFQPFFTTKRTGEGTGLGLSISYEIIKAHGGEMLVNTEEGKYAEFIIQLPMNNK